MIIRWVTTSLRGAMQLSPSDVGHILTPGTETPGKRKLYAALLRISRAALREPTPAALCLEVCRVAVESGGFLLAWIGWHDPPCCRTSGSPCC